jgi:hypothetical protein
VESNKTFVVCIDEIRQNFVFGDTFSGGYTRSVTMSDGSVREIALCPMMKNGHLVVELKDGGHVSYMGPNGTTTNGSLMISLAEIDALTDDSAASTR